ncbi:hypothetical protein DZF83_25405 [Vibrio parahaemolyticus]|nr:hypothetical protein [Vibrio parahaemolyticus]
MQLFPSFLLLWLRWGSNALLSSEARYANASALLRNHKTNRKPKMPRVANLLKLFVMRFVRIR